VKFWPSKGGPFLFPLNKHWSWEQLSKSLMHMILLYPSASWCSCENDFVLDMYPRQFSDHLLCSGLHHFDVSTSQFLDSIVPVALGDLRDLLFASRVGNQSQICAHSETHNDNKCLVHS
jgi:hypothetical protein